MKATVTSAATTHENDHAEPMKFSKRIGSTTYVVAVHFSQTSSETIEDKLFRLIEREVENVA